MFIFTLFAICRYMNFFPTNNTMENKIVFEKSATYFDTDIVPKRVQALLPDVKLVRYLTLQFFLN